MGRTANHSAEDMNLLRILKDAGLIPSHREGKEVCYRAVETPKTQLLHEALETLMTIQCPMEE